MTEIVFVSGRNCCGKTQLAYALWGCKRAGDNTHYEVTEMLDGTVTSIAVAECSCVRLYETQMGEKFLLVDGAPLGIAPLPALLEVATRVGASEVWIRGCYHPCLEKAPFSQFAYSPTIRRVYFEFATEDELAAERDGSPFDLKQDAGRRRWVLITTLKKKSDKRLKALRARCTAKDYAQTELRLAKTTLETAEHVWNDCLQRQCAIEARLSALAEQVATVTEALMPPVPRLDIAKVVETVLASPTLEEILPTLQHIAGEYLEAEQQVAVRDFEVRQHHEIVRTLERKLARTRDCTNQLREEVQANAALHTEFEELREAAASD